MDIQYYDNLSCVELLDKIFKLNELIFSHSSREKLLEDMSSKNRLSLAMAYDKGHPIGFKLGYEQQPGRYYSWLGGVLDDYRGQGVARQLMDMQHQWCKKNGYLKVQTKTKNKWKGMLILNLKCGFDIIGTYTDSVGEPKIILEKVLSPAD